MNLEIKRFINFHKIEEFQFNPFFPINTITIQRNSLVAKEEGIFSQYTDITAKAMWEQQINLGDAQILIDTLNTAGIDGKMIVDKASDPKLRKALSKIPRWLLIMVLWSTNIFCTTMYFLAKRL